ncbi:hypothetical protein FUAX_41350 (plasmid) [Fulvitalea axinellae]|uniref:Lipoprotein n=1 Tax=Fulvitalea axinellae TaxID=1182444 RepID=A0AAU9CUH2_9BACT|nr:hypothetical protein FUAX_41350 [Fulvitalea axinellae]
MRKLTAISVLFASIIFSACSAFTGEEVGRLPINKISTDNTNKYIQETSLNLKKGDVIAIWSEMDLAFRGNLDLKFIIEVLRDGEKLDGFEIDPSDKKMTIGELRTTVSGATDWSFLGRHRKMSIEKDGNYTFKGKLVSSKNSSVKIKKAEIVLKK